MTIQTRDFGEINIDTSEVITFVSPIYGFENLKRFVILSNIEIGKEFVWIQSIEDKDVCFITVNPQIIVSDYHIIVGNEIKSLLSLSEEKEIVYRSIVVITDDFSKSTVNLKSPIIINPANKLAAQIIVEENYPIRAFLVKKEGE